MCLVSKRASVNGLLVIGSSFCRVRKGNRYRGWLAGWLAGWLGREFRGLGGLNVIERGKKMRECGTELNQIRRGIDDYEMNKQMNQLLRLWKVKEGEKDKEGKGR